ncbi:MAG: Na+/H+ antiporter [uncultured Nocardioidaceae bacterium]|uniref:Na+/H+ antiporter n=1 Tax=uncultured Nocardioidaceae bacterium TaxID=253824 RepID=A0A6J4MDX8_9ACTN|nr:MAG: Na+/H+ antiporter [uncultured Nocardioidaceae bacterium]
MRSRPVTGDDGPVHVALGLVSLVLAVLVLTAAAERVRFPPPVLLVAAGAAAAYVPGVPEVRLTAEVVLVGLLPPLLYSTALRTSLVDFTANRRSILLLSIGLVVFTTLGVAVVVRLVLPSVPWWTAFAIGAVVAPPDAVAATAVARRIGLPRRLVTVLEGESLLNDATALVALRTSLGAAMVSVSVVDVGVAFLETALGGVLVGVLVYLVVGWVRRRLVEPVIDTSISLVTPFIAYVAAEELHVSGVLAVVVAGLLLGHRAPVLQTPSSRISESLNWRTMAFLLEGAVFLLIGLQLRWILAEVQRSAVPGPRIAVACVAVLLAVVVLRLAWVFPVRRYLIDRGLDRDQRRPWQETAVVGWTGMRGVVTLAAAFAIPPDAPAREVLLLIAFTVTAGTLALQGLSLPWLVRRLGVPGPDPREDALARAELLQQATQAGLAKLEEVAAQEALEEGDPVPDVLRQRLEQRDFAAWERLGTVRGQLGEDVDETPTERYARIRLAMLDAERERVLELRKRGRTPHEVVEDVLRMLDVEESVLDARVAQRRALVESPAAGRRTRTPAASGRAVDACEHLAGAAALAGPAPRECGDCLEEGLAWVHLRQCTACGHVGCCDSSPGRHADRHFNREGHPVMASVEPGEGWRWCFVDRIVG